LLLKLIASDKVGAMVLEVLRLVSRDAHESAHKRLHLVSHRSSVSLSRSPVVHLVLCCL
jgi:hypothetical protein